jgi:hypothetical protein
MVRVVASDGVLTSQATSGAFIVAKKAPQVTIALPRPNASLPPGAPMLLKGSTHDAEDGMLDPAVLSWHSNRDGDLGTGTDRLLTEPSHGWHTITLTATDSDDNPSSESVDVYVGYRVYLPLVVRGSSSP